MSRQNYYARRQTRRRREVDAGLVVELVRQERQLQPRLGGRKLHFMLKGTLAEAGVKLGRDRFFEVLREEELLVPPRVGEQVHTTNSRHSLPVFGNRIRGLEANLPNQAWLSDLTFLRTEEGFEYLALISDLVSRKIVGYACVETLEAARCLGALEMALESLPAGAHPIHHSDRGSQYCSHEYVNRLEQAGLGISMTERDHCAENAQAERLNGILKAEYGLGGRFRDRAAARLAVEQAVWLYNTRRPHTALGYRCPAQVHELAE